MVKVVLPAVWLTDRLSMWDEPMNLLPMGEKGREATLLERLGGGGARVMLGETETPAYFKRAEVSVVEFVELVVWLLVVVLVDVWLVVFVDV